MSTPKLRPFCHAKSKRTKRRCGQHVLVEGDVCKWHGKGGGRPIIHGRYSKLPKRIADAFEAARADPQLLDLSEGVALLDALMQERIGRMAAGDSPEWRKDLLERFDFAITLAAGDPSKLAKVLTACRELLVQGCDSDRAEAAIFAMREKVSARVEELWKIRLARGSVVNARDLAAMRVMELRELRRYLESKGVPLAIQQGCVAAMIALASGSNASPPEYRAELNAAALEVAGGRI